MLVFQYQRRAIVDHHLVLWSVGLVVGIDWLVLVISVVKFLLEKGVCCYYAFFWTFSWLVDLFALLVHIKWWREEVFYFGSVVDCFFLAITITTSISVHVWLYLAAVSFHLQQVCKFRCIGWVIVKIFVIIRSICFSSAVWLIFFACLVLVLKLWSLNIIFLLDFLYLIFQLWVEGLKISSCISWFWCLRIWPLSWRWLHGISIGTLKLLFFNYLWCLCHWVRINPFWFPSIIHLFSFRSDCLKRIFRKANRFFLLIFLCFPPGGGNSKNSPLLLIRSGLFLSILPVLFHTRTAPTLRSPPITNLKFILLQQPDKTIVGVDLNPYISTIDLCALIFR